MLHTRDAIAVLPNGHNVCEQTASVGEEVILFIITCLSQTTFIL